MNSMQHSLEVYNFDELIFSSDGKWLHPLLDLKVFLDNHKYDPHNIHVEDKIIGRAAASILVYLNITSCYGEVISNLGLEILEQHDINYSYGKLVSRIECKTEEILKGVSDPEEAYRIIVDRAKLAANPDLK